MCFSVCLDTCAKFSGEDYMSVSIYVFGLGVRERLSVGKNCVVNKSSKQQRQIEREQR